MTQAIHCMVSLMAVAVTLPAMAGPAPSVAPTPWSDHAHSLFAKVLSEVVEDGRVNYTWLKEHPEALDSHLDHLASVSEPEHSG